jgi:hypothetical protein
VNAFPITVRLVRTRREANEFTSVAAIAQSANPRWAQTLDIEASLFFNARLSPFVKRNPIERFVAYRGERPVGRVAAVHDLEHLACHHDSNGHFGLLEAIDDPDVFKALMSAAERWLSSRGLFAISGPYNLSINHEVGLLVKGFDEPHTVKTNYAPPYYSRYLEAIGYTKVMDTYAQNVLVRPALAYAQHVRKIEAKRAPRGFSTRKLSFGTWRRSFVKLLQLYNETWAMNWNAVPMAPDEAEALANAMLPVVKPDWVEIAYLDEEPIAIMAMIPDINEIVLPFRGRLLPFNWIRLLWGLHVRGVTRARMPLLGVLPQWQRHPAGALAPSVLMAGAIETAARNNLTTIELSWILEANDGIARLIGQGMRRRTPGAVQDPSRVFRIYGKSLTR